MGRHNQIRRQKRGSVADRYDSDYIDLPEHPEISRIIAVPLKTIYHNISAAPDAMEIYTAQSWSDKILQLLVTKI